jgi:hypothetical protein
VLADQADPDEVNFDAMRTFVARLLFTVAPVIEAQLADEGVVGTIDPPVASTRSPAVPGFAIASSGLPEVTVWAVRNMS